MYRVMIVDDEPTSLLHIRTILEKKCGDYQVVQAASHGREALEKISGVQPDVIISDIKMPIMDGIELAKRVKEDFPDILFLIVSGHQEFEYAKSAIQFGVCDYLLKPLKPADLQGIMDRLRGKLNGLYYTRRREMLKAMCNNIEITDKTLLARYFPGGKYYSGIIRRNGLPRRFTGRMGIEIFSMEEEQVYIYGRDEMEALYLVPEELLAGDDFNQVMQGYFAKTQTEDSYTTAVVYEEQFELDIFPYVAKKIYRQLDETIVIGRDQMNADQAGRKKGNMESGDRELIQYITHLIKHRESSKLRQKIIELFEVWNQEERTQMYVEGQIRYIFQHIKNQYGAELEYGGLEYEIDVAFFYASSMEELRENILELLVPVIPECGRAAVDDKEQLFHSILSYLEENMDKNITLSSICRQFGISQTALSKLFRNYQECSFGKYLTMIRIGKAKQIMEQDSDIFIKDVAAMVGYADQFYFSRLFHSVEGICPSDYIARQNGLAV